VGAIVGKKVAKEGVAANSAIANVDIDSLPQEMIENLNFSDLTEDELEVLEALIDIGNFAATSIEIQEWLEKNRKIIVCDRTIRNRLARVRSSMWTRKRRQALRTAYKRFGAQAFESAMMQGDWRAADRLAEKLGVLPPVVQKSQVEINDSRDKSDVELAATLKDMFLKARDIAAKDNVSNSDKKDD